MKGIERASLAGALVLAICLVAVSALSGPGDARRPRPTPLQVRPTPEPLVPTVAPRSDLPTAAPPPAIKPARRGPVMGSIDPTSDRRRIGVGLPLGDFDDYDWGDAAPGWYLRWGTLDNPPAYPGVRFAQMVFTIGREFSSPLPEVRAVAARHPGSLWLIGNEPDVAWQGNSTPEEYVEVYGTLYAAIKEVDPGAQVAIGGVSQPTPLRLAYLDRVLAAYEARWGEAMPIDVWNVHAFILREERDSWGVGIPPGMTEPAGQLYEIGDHTDLAIFQAQVIAFRRWMKERGLQEKPLIVSEYGVLMPEDYGFPPEKVADFMVASFDFFLTARDPELGQPADDGRLVQAFCWYSVADTRYATPNLFDPGTGAATQLGDIFKEYLRGLP